MTDLTCIKCEWFKSDFDIETEIGEYIDKTELLPEHFGDQTCPECGGEHSLETVYKTCYDCMNAEPDCTCDVEIKEVSEEEKKKAQRAVMRRLEELKENTDLEEERNIRKFRRNDLRRIAENLIEKKFKNN